MGRLEVIHMALVANSAGHTEAMRLAETTYLFGMRNRLLRRLHDGDYRSALLVCRRALACEEQQVTSGTKSMDPNADVEYRAPLLQLLGVINRLRLEMRTR
jgi:hypothetical protein